MLHTIKDQAGGVVPTVPWAPTVRYPMLHGFSAAAWQRTSRTSVLTFLGAVILMVGVAIASNNDADLLGSAGTHTGSQGRRRAADDRAECIRCTQWALGAAASTNDTMYSYGAVTLEALARNDLTGASDKAILDPVWAGSCTKMRDNEIRRLLAECSAVIEREKAESIPRHSLRRDVGCQDEKGESLASRGNVATRRSLADHDPTTKDQVFARLRREILAARLKVTLDEQLGRKTSPIVTHLAGMNLPSIGRPGQSGDN